MIERNGVQTVCVFSRCNKYMTYIYISITSTSTHLPLSFDWFLEIVKAERLERQNSWCEKRQEIVRQHVVKGECLFVSQYQQTTSNAVI